MFIYKQFGSQTDYNAACAPGIIIMQDA